VLSGDKPSRLLLLLQAAAVLPACLLLLGWLAPCLRDQLAACSANAAALPLHQRVCPPLPPFNAAQMTK
jgi:hypothetical protein